MKFRPIAGDRCLKHHEYNGGTPYEDVDCLMPFMRNWYTEYERNFTPIAVFHWMEERPWIPIVAVTVYGISILYGVHYFKTRPAWDWRFTLGMWNLFLAIFSLGCLIRLLPVLCRDLFNYSVREFFCMDGGPRFAHHGASLWGLFFLWSKFFELFDTFFIIIHKKPLLLLHWYHHITVLLFCWFAYMAKNPVSIVFATMNSAVHAIMYFYYFLMAMRIKPKAFNAKYITIAQISQMVVGVSVSMTSVYLLWFDKEVLAVRGTAEECVLKEVNNTAAFVMYGSYLLLFLQFFIRRFLTGGGKDEKSKLNGASNGKTLKAE